MIKLRKNENTTEDFWLNYTLRSCKSSPTYELILRYIPNNFIIQSITFSDYKKELKIENILSNLLTDIKKQVDPKYIEISLYLNLCGAFKNYGQDGWDEFANYRLAEIQI